MKQQQIRLRERPDGWPSEETFSYEEVEVKEPTQDEVTLKPAISQLIRTCEEE